MNKIIRFGEDVEGYDVPVLNEREIRAAAGILFLFLFISLMFILFRGEFILFKYGITIFLTDFVLRVFVSPRFSPTLIMGRLIVGGQQPEYVGAAQKRFAWIIGLVLAAIMFVLLVVANATSPITGLICLTCLIFLFFESAFGICLGCKFYPLFHKEKAQYCPGAVCEVKARQSIQRTSAAQIAIVFGLVAYVALTAFLFNDTFSRKPHNMFRNGRSSARSALGVDGAAGR
jgi:hypothetical protein